MAIKKGVNMHCDWPLESATIIFFPQSINHSWISFKLMSNVDVHYAKCSSFIIMTIKHQINKHSRLQIIMICVPIICDVPTYIS